MQYTSRYQSPLGELLLAADGIGLTGAWFAGQRHFASRLDAEREERETPLLATAKTWLDVYFSGQDPAFSVPLHFTGTPFQNDVWGALCAIPYGQTATYGAIARRIAAGRGLPHLSARAVGGAVGRNAISLFVPCHRVVGAHGDLTGYAGGLDRKARLLRLERAGAAPAFAP
ncbi:MAG: methylated-DNA--[protein]-cysteine S-methyltransferase [Kiritimatiellia bacterium]